MDYEITDEDVELVLEAVGVDVEEMNAVADESSRSESDGKYRSCGCGFEGETTEPECPECGTEWFIDPVTGDVNGF